MRSAYCRAQARWLRWQEEIELLLEEMSRVTLFLLWKANWWESRVSMRPDINPALASGVGAYAYRQRWIFESLARKFYAKWVPFLTKNSLSVQWCSELSSFEISPSIETTTNVAGATSSTAATSLLPAGSLSPNSALASLGEPRIVEMNTVQDSDDIEADAEEENEDEVDEEGGGGDSGGKDTDAGDSDEDGYDSAY